ERRGSSARSRSLPVRASFPSVSQSHHRLADGVRCGRKYDLLFAGRSRWRFAAVLSPESLSRKSRLPCASFDHLVGAGEQGGRHTETERFRGPEIDDQLELGRLLDRQVCRVGTFQDLINVGGGTPEQVGTVYPI